MILFIDNYDSFTYNLVDLFGQLEPNLLVARNDKISIDRIRNLRPAGIVLSPGPGTPKDAGICCEVISYFYREIPILGVCLGHQCIGAVFGAKIIRAPEPVHGKTSEIFHDNSGIFADLPAPFTATRYHSLIIDEKTAPAELEITARTKDELIMAIRHRQFPLTGVQFHPESILTNCGFAMLKNWLNQVVIQQGEKSNEHRARS